MPLRGGNAQDLLDLALDSRTGICRHAGRMTLRQTEEHKRQHNEKPRQNRSRPSHIARIRCRPEYQKRHLDVVVGKVETANMSRRFGLVQQEAKSRAKQLRNTLIAQVWDGRSKVIVISNGEPALAISQSSSLVGDAIIGRVLSSVGMVVGVTMAV